MEDELVEGPDRARTPPTLSAKHTVPAADCSGTGEKTGFEHVDVAIVVVPVPTASVIPSKFTSTVVDVLVDVLGTHALAVTGAEHEERPSAVPVKHS